MTTSLDELALGQNYFVIGKAIGKNGLYQSIHFWPVESNLKKCLGSSVEMNANIYKLFEKG